MKSPKNAWRILHDSKREYLKYNDGYEVKINNESNTTYIMVGGHQHIEIAELIAHMLTVCDAITILFKKVTPFTQISHPFLYQALFRKDFAAKYPNSSTDES